MKILAVDTSSSGCSVAVLEDAVALAELTINNRETHSRHLLKNIDDVLAQSGLDFVDVDGVAVSTGPGSFTGLRIGLSTVKGLSVATGVPVAGVSSLRALAFGSPFFDCNVCAVIDARKNEVYTGIFKCAGNAVETISDECVISPAQLVERIDGKTLFVGSGLTVYKDIILETVGSDAFFCDDEFSQINAVNVGVLALSEFRNSDSQVVDVLPYYIRKSDAEIGLEKRLLNQK